MAKASILLLFIAFVVSMSMVSLMVLGAERENHSSSSSLSGILWSAGMAEGDLLAMADPSPVEEQTDEFAGGFSSLDGMLQWAIGHSDPAKLKEKASDVRRLSADELKKRQLEIKDLMDKLKMPSDAELMRIAIADLNNSSISLEDRQRALNELLILVEPIDNANNLDKLGGLVAVVHELHNSEPEIRTTSAWILGKASQNNALVQKQILALGALTNFRDFCDLDGVLERLREHLENLMTQEDLRDYARDIEALRREVYIIFHKKLEKVTWVPT